MNASTEPPTTLVSPARHRPILPAWVFAVVCLIVTGVGSCANAVVLTVLVRARQHFGSSVHTLIANQSAMDLSACAIGFCSIVVVGTRAYKYNGNAVLDRAICVIFDSCDKIRDK